MGASIADAFGSAAFRSAAVRTFLIWIALAALGTPSHAQGVAALFSAPSSSTSLDPAALPPALRSRAVSVDFAALAADPATLRLNLFPDVDVVASSTGIESLASGSRVWKGRIDSLGGGEATLVFRPGSLAGSVRIAGDQYEIQPLAQGDHAIVQVDRAALNLGDDSEAAAPTFALRMGGLPDDGSVIDILVGYTQQLAAALPPGGIDPLIELRVEDTNQALANSGIPTRLRLVRTVAVVDSEAAGIVQALQAPNDGRMDEMHPIRDAYHADLVAMCTLTSGENDVAGRGYVGGAFNFSLCNLTFPFRHEIGHNLGCDHDRAHATPAGGLLDHYNYGYGFLGLSGSWLDIMGYNGGNIPLYSAADVLWDGVPAGVPYPDPDPSTPPDPADCSRAIEERLPVTAEFERSAFLVPDTLLVLSDHGAGVDVFGLEPHSATPQTLFHDPYQILPGAVAIAYGGNDKAYGLELTAPSSHDIIEIDLERGTAHKITPVPHPFIGSAITTGPNGHLYVTAFKPNCTTYPGLVMEVDPATGGIVTSWQGNELCQPVGIAIATNGDLLVAEACGGAGCTGPGRILRIRPWDGYQTVLSSGGNLGYLASMGKLRDDDLVVLSRNAAGWASLVRVDVETGAQTVLASNLAQDYYGSIAALPDGDVVVAAGAGLLRYDAATGTTAPVAAAATLGSLAVDVVPPVLPACADQSDNDGDGLRDYPDDPGCSSYSDTSEAYACADGVDNDGDGRTDYPSDPGCSSATDDDEHGVACDNGRDDDGDGKIDYPADPGCSSLSDTTEASGGGGCGLGFEVAPIAWLLDRLRKRAMRGLRARP